MKKPELLAPAGNMECLDAAIKAGCDAVYIGGKFFGARNYAGNFDNEEIIEAVKYAHTYGVKVYVTVNIIVYEAEVKSLLEYVDFLHKNNVDAIIMQDIGMMDLVRKTYPNLEIHASTQMHIHNLEGAKLVESLGLKRAVLARETPTKLIKEIKDNTNIELEIFIHGALCISYSGECLMSSLIGGRSGNRGTCSQCCRLKYDVISDSIKLNKGEYPLSTKDLNSIMYIDKLIDIGVDSLKIEGRMKRKEYVYLVVSMYRKAIDSYIETGKINIAENDIQELKKIFNREFTKGFLNEEDNSNIIHSDRPNHMGIEVGQVIDIKNDEVTIKLTDKITQGDGIRILNDIEDTGCILNMIYKGKNLIKEAYPNETITIKVRDKVSIGDIVVKTSDIIQLNEINKQLLNNRKVHINAYMECYKNKPIYLKFIDDKNNIVESYSESLIEESKNHPMNEDSIKKQIEKLGNTPYIIDNIELISDSNIFIRINDLNEIRRDLVSKLTDKRLYQTEYKKDNYYIDISEIKDIKGTNVLVKTIEDYNKYKDECVEIYVEDEELYKQIKNDSKVVLKLPRVLEHLNNYNQKLLVGELGSVYKYKDVYTDFSLNVVNSYSVAFLHSIGVKRVTLSYELNDFQIEKLINNYRERYNLEPNLELIYKGYPETMISKYNILDAYNIKGNKCILKDKFNNEFRVEKKNNLTTIYYYKELKLADPNRYLSMGINRIRINLD